MACSDRRRAVRSRRKRIPPEVEEVRALGGLLQIVLETAGEAKATREKYGAG